jgi:D-glycero-D-manno-heptose 1,7-bisphosphate phosphatase
MALTPAIFLDKDGTLLADVPYNVNPRRMRFAAGALEGLRHLATLGRPLIVVSNQSGIALGKFEPADMGSVLTELKRMFNEANAILSGMYFCPHHPNGSRPRYSMMCGCRKPAPGLLLRAARVQSLDLNNSWFIGDILDDVEAGRRAGCRTLFIDNGNETEWLRNEWRVPDHSEPDLGAAGKWLAEVAS